MRFHWQNLNDSKKPKWGGGFRHGRAWWNRFHCEWCLFYSPRLHLTFSSGGFSIALLVFTIYFSWEDYEHVRSEFRFNVDTDAVRFTLWGNGDWDSKDPWWKNGVSFHYFDFLLGRMKCAHEKGETIDVLIPMPEGCYAAKLTFEKRMWKRPRWKSFSRETCDIHIPGGIPFLGKGENSYDCGDDGLWGIGSNSHDVEKAIGTVVTSVLESRKRYGNTARVQLAMLSVVSLNEKEFAAEVVNE